MHPVRALLPLLVTALLATGAGALPASAASADAAAPQHRIIGGQVAQPGTWPGLVGVLVRSYDPTYYDQYCAGTIISSFWILTAAHCVFYEQTSGSGAWVQADPDDLNVLTETQTLSTTSSDPGRRRAVHRIVPHPDYRPGSDASDHDVALLEVQAPLTHSVVAVPDVSLSPLWAPGTTARTAGWGDMNPNRDTEASYPLDLMDVDMPIVSDADCGAPSAYGAAFRPATMICAGDLAAGGRGPCQADDGGPLVVNDRAHRPLLVGVTSFSQGCAAAGKPAVYARVTGLRSFIDATIGWSADATVLSLSPSFTRSPWAGLTPPQTVTLRSSGGAPTSISAVRLAGAGADQFAIEADSCTQIALATYDTCSVTVRAQPTRAADASAQLEFDRDGRAAATTVPLSFHDLTPPATPPFESPIPQRPEDLLPPDPRRPVAPRVTKLTVLAPRNGKHRVSVGLSAAGSVTATFSVTKKVGRKRRTVKIGTAWSSFSAAGTHTAVVALTSAGRSQLRKSPRLAVTAKLVTLWGGATATTTQRLTLR